MVACKGCSTYTYEVVPHGVNNLCAVGTDGVPDHVCRGGDGGEALRAAQEGHPDAHYYRRLHPEGTVDSVGAYCSVARRCLAPDVVDGTRMWTTDCCVLSVQFALYMPRTLMLS
jgi:hypothetical protein